MQTVLGANGQIADELAEDLWKNYTRDIRLVSRSPRRVNDSDELFSANLLDDRQTGDAVNGSEVVYLTVGVPMSTRLWQEQFPVIMQNVISACAKHNAKLVFFDNTYMYPQNNGPLTEQTKFDPVGPKGRVRADLANMLLQAVDAGKLQAVICRAPEFYGPGKTRSITNSWVFERIKRGKMPRVLLRDDTLRTLIWTPDASRATAIIGNMPDAYNQTWHLPCDDNRLTYRGIIEHASWVCGNELHYKVLNKPSLKLVSLFNKRVKEILELLPRYEQDNLFVSGKFKKRFPHFEVTSYKKGIEMILNKSS
ncbi:MAG TPA: NAD-dependent epimerase/dehydratase family protein [Chitinophagaceae bacterium]|nr:NAD-dependent epimerase/dehydratase family protein [Chitinophagaceae bacterium]